jgi:hypothetical protein
LEGAGSAKETLIMRRWIGSLSLVVLATLLAASTASAQCNPRIDGERVLEKLERARVVVERSQVEEARLLLAAAGRRLQEAGRLERERKREQACMNIRAAESLIEKALEVAVRTDVVQGELERELVRTDEFLRELAGEVRECGVREAARMLDGAFRQQDEAWRAFRAQRARLAYKITLNAREHGKRARRSCEGDRGLGAEAVEAELGRTDRYLEEAARVLRDRDARGPQKQQLEHAIAIQAEAWRHHRGNRPVLAMQLTRQSRATARRALAGMAKEPQAEDIQFLIETTGELLDRLREEAEASDDDSAGRLLEQATRLLEEARGALQAGRNREALGSARAASALALDVSERLGGGE